MAEDVKQASTRAYVVLQLSPANSWVEQGQVTASSDLAAIRQIAEVNPDDASDGKYVAVPVRSWRPRTRQVKTVTRDLWS